MSLAPRSAFEVAADLLYPQPDPYVDNPVGWVQDKLGGFMWSKQREIAESVRDNRYTSVKSCHASGKSKTAARIASWWLSVHPVGEAFVVTTAPTWAQVQAILWREIAKEHRAGGLEGKITRDAKWHMGNELVAYGRKPADYDQAAFQGIHARYVLVIIDEADGVPQSLFEAVDSIVTNATSRVLAIGNPDNPTSHFCTVCKPGSGWNTIKVSAFDTPAFTGEDVPPDLLELLVGPEWVQERKERWGETSPIYTSKVLGEFPDISDDTLIHPRWITAALNREIKPVGAGTLGVDIARYGSDETTMYLSRGGHTRLHAAHRQADTMTTAGLVVKARSDIDKAPGADGFIDIVVDEVGVGAGVYDRLRELSMPVVGFGGGTAPRDKERFVNARAEEYWNLRTAFENEEIDLDKADDQLLAQLGAIKWKINSSGKILIESKDEMRARGLPSPDRADGAMYSRVRRAAMTVAVADHVSGSTIAGDVMTMNWG